MQIAESADWTGLLLAIGIVVGLLAGHFLVGRLARSWIRWRSGFGRSAQPAAQPVDANFPESSPSTR
jgi:hypothetical protein